MKRSLPQIFSHLTNKRIISHVMPDSIICAHLNDSKLVSGSAVITYIVSNLTYRAILTTNVV